MLSIMVGAVGSIETNELCGPPSGSPLHTLIISGGIVFF